MITTDVITSDIPMLLSKTAMKAAKIKIDFAEDEIEAFGEKAKIHCTTSGHPLLHLHTGKNGDNLMEVSVKDMEVLMVNFEMDSEKDKVKALVKLHRQFGHTPEEKFVDLLKTAEFVDLLKNAGVWHPDMKQHLDKIRAGCVGCLQRRRNPDRPAVAMPMASKFNKST